MADTNGPPTPKMTASIARGPILAEVSYGMQREADRLCEEMIALAFRCEKDLTMLDYRRSAKLRADAKPLQAIAARAYRLGKAFDAWSAGDPGDEQRHADLARLLDLRAEARELGL
jgi:hypothetical protein